MPHFKPAPGAFVKHSVPVELVQCIVEFFKDDPASYLHWSQTCRELSTACHDRLVVMKLKWKDLRKLPVTDVLRQKMFYAFVSKSLCLSSLHGGFVTHPYRRLRKDQFAQIAIALSEVPTLRYLHLKRIGIGAISCKLLAPSLSIMKNLKVLDLSNNNICTKEAYEFLFPALKNVSGLETLLLKGNGIDASAIETLVPALTQMVALERLDMSCNRLNGAAIRCLIPAFEAMKSLKDLLLEKQMLSFSAYKEGEKEGFCKDTSFEIAAMIPRMYALENLWVFGNDIDPVAENVLQAAWEAAGKTGILDC
jgi:hypothetical protein